jgi:hypothetical protein
MLFSCCRIPRVFEPDRRATTDCESDLSMPSQRLCTLYKDRQVLWHSTVCLLTQMTLCYAGSCRGCAGELGIP